MQNISEPLVYVVDDDQDEHRLLQTVFDRHHSDCVLRCFSDGTELVTQLTHRLDGRLPDLILLDWHMPVLAGYDVLRLLKGDFEWRTIPVVIRSSSDRDRDIDRCYDLGGNAFIIKSNTLNHLTASIGNLMKQWLI
jgi:CheY-like chemotaxis protein